MLGMISVSAQDDDNIFTHLGASLGVGTTGISLDLSTNITDYVGVRAGVDFIPQVKYKTDVEIYGAKEYQSKYDSWRATLPSSVTSSVNAPVVTIPSKVDIEGKLNNTTGHLLFDLYPGSKIDWHLTLGAYFGPSKVISVYTPDGSQLRGIHEYNQFVTSNPALGADYKIGAELGDYFLEPDENGVVDASIKVAGFRPYVGIGWGRAVPKNHTLGFSFDLGCQFWGSPKVYLQDKELTTSDLDGEDGGAIKTLTKISVYPTLTLRLTGKIF